ncbi:MAG: lasso peptide biosynthesis B2 protein [Gammaproteobacteria bacterium]|nr:lasso peptide biosynthesis B2 protein [Gammaproteobacteria bacterium]MCH9763108.1 lasso peptide biosynthesis B2 protein [Gammaproteobacteria bacterium]
MRSILKKIFKKNVKKKVYLFWHLPFKLKILFCINFFLCGIARACILLFPLKRLSPYFGILYKNIMCSTILSKKQLRHATQLRRSIKLAAKYTPWNSNCLTQAMVAKFWCQQLNIPYILYIGFAKNIDKPNGYAAHAWLTAGPIAITGELSFPHYQVISSYVPNAIMPTND